MIAVALPTYAELMQEGATLQQDGKPDQAYTAFLDAYSSAATSHQKAAAHQGAAINARLNSDLTTSVILFGSAVEHAQASGNQLLVAKILRDQGATQEALFRVTLRFYHQEQAERLYKKSIDILETLLNDAHNHSKPDYELRAELAATKSFQGMLDWNTAGVNKEGREIAKLKIFAAYRELMLVNATIAHDAKRGLTTLEPFEVYETNALMREVRSDPGIFRRFGHRKELMELTSQQSQSPGRRPHAIVALIGGEMLYDMLSLRKARKKQRAEKLASRG